MIAPWQKSSDLMVSRYGFLIHHNNTTSYGSKILLVNRPIIQLAPLNHASLVNPSVSFAGISWSVLLIFGWQSDYEVKVKI